MLDAPVSREGRGAVPEENRGGAEGGGASDWRRGDPETALRAFPALIPQAFLDLVSGAETAGDSAGAAALRRQLSPTEGENALDPCERPDPLGEASHCVFPRLVHQYENRVLLLSTGRCLGYCRYCFRRSFAAEGFGFISEKETDEICGYIDAHGEVDEVLVSGGDPMSAPFSRVESLLRRLRNVRPSLLIRLCTRAPIFAPGLFTRGVVSVLRGLRPLWVIPHVNHPAELGPPQRECLSRCIDSGVSVQSQTVLLRGVNDDALVLSRLFNSLVRLGVKPGYLFQCDLAPGTSGFRVPLDEALCLWKDLVKTLSGLSLPRFAVDLPGGGGKFPLAAAAFADNIVSCSGGRLVVETDDKKVYTYPV